MVYTLHASQDPEVGITPYMPSWVGMYGTIASLGGYVRYYSLPGRYTRVHMPPWWVYPGTYASLGVYAVHIASLGVYAVYIASLVGIPGVYSSLVGIPGVYIASLVGTPG